MNATEKNQLEQPNLPLTDPLVLQSVTSPGEVTLREARNRLSLEENEAIIEYERGVWETNRKLQISKVKSLVEKQISDQGIVIDDEMRAKIYKDLGHGFLPKEDKDPKIPTTDEFFNEESDKQPFDLTSEIGLDMLSPSDEEFELKQLEELLKYTDYTRLPFKIKMLFPNVSFDTDIETSLATIGMFQAEIIGKERAQERTGNEDLVQQTKEETQIALFIAKALAPVIQKQQKDQQEEDLKMGIIPQGRKEIPMPTAKPKGASGPNAPGPQSNNTKNQLDLKNRTNAATRLQKRAGLQNAASRNT